MDDKNVMSDMFMPLCISYRVCCLALVFGPWLIVIFSYPFDAQSIPCT